MFVWHKFADGDGIARAIQDSLLKDFGSKSEFSDWFSREDEPSAAAQPKRKVVIEPNPVNVEHEQKIAALEARIKRYVVQLCLWRAPFSDANRISTD